MKRFHNDDKTRRLLRIALFFSLAIILVTTTYGIIMSILLGVEVVGQTFVDVEFPPIHIFPFFYMKPITWLTFAILLFVYSSLEYFKERFMRTSGFTRNLIKTSSFLLTSLSVYEILFNFVLWSGLIASDAILGQLNPDVIINPFPNPEIPWNIVFATKLYLVFTIVFGYLFYFFIQIEQNLSTQS